MAGAVGAGRFVSSGLIGGFGPKYFAQTRMTPIDSNDATRIRNSGVNLSFCPGTLTAAPHAKPLPHGGNVLHQYCGPSPLPISLACSPISPEPGRNQICARADDTAAAASV